MEEVQQNRGRQPQLWLRFTAIVVAALLVCSAILLDAVTVKLAPQQLQGTDVTAAAGNYLVDSTPYVKEDVLRRAQTVLAGMLIKPTTLEQYYDLASRAIASEDYASALPLIDVCLSLADAPDTVQAMRVDLRMKKACLLALKAEYYQALALFDQALSMDASQAQAHLIKTQIYAQLNRPADATQSLSAYVKLEPEDASMRTALIQLYYAQGEYAKAEAACAAYLERFADTGGAVHFLRGACRLQEASYEAATDDLVQAAQLGYSDAGLCYGQAALCAYALGKSELVLQYGRQSAELNSKQMDYGKLYTYMGLSCMLLKNFQDAEKQFTSALSYVQNPAPVRYYRGVSRMAQELTDAAVEDFSGAITGGETTAQCYYNRGACYLKLRERDKALQDMRRVVSLNTDAELTSLAQSVIRQLEKA